MTKAPASTPTAPPTTCTKAPPRIAVIGAGSWGTALAVLLAGRWSEVTLWCREAEVAAGIREQRRNPLFLTELTLPVALHTETDLATVVRGNDILVMVVPTAFTRGILQSMVADLPPKTILVSASKGIEVESLTPLSQIYAECFGPGIAARLGFLSGPSFAREVILGLPTAVAVASREARVAERIQELFFTPAFRTYVTDDVAGVELGGALKNIIAIAAGISDGLNLGHGARAALVTRGLAEMVRFGLRFGARQETFSGLSGLGDLLLTATSDLSRNRRVGLDLGRGESLEVIQGKSREVAEGVKTTRSVHALSARLGIEMPITRAVHKILYEGGTPREVVRELMERDLKAENLS
ncbi:MAG: NAD(P)-dependent glycerol-3-phosphate dehydrogenase [Magnetococcales bacterium]|nr:NAD(P)-dependent glycerol-3-phosphate dehydrogenase [Magnetococcales bacterium]MBF0157404.1 NAD(P)-dependent glycerol-3-phosphate dehydrogenase [Magnetococcales bacterium]